MLPLIRNFDTARLAGDACKQCFVLLLSFQLCRLPDDAKYFLYKHEFIGVRILENSAAGPWHDYLGTDGRAQRAQGLGCELRLLSSFPWASDQVSGTFSCHLHH
jgi:hypothetical protein